MNKKIIQIVVAVLFCQMAGIIGTIFTVSAIPSWYNFLNKPFFNPPSWLFGPVWTILYTLMGITFYMVWSEKTEKVKKQWALGLFFVQLFLNAIWSPIFFGLKNPLAALIVIVLMWVAILLTILNFYKISKTAAVLLIPYLGWVSFATVLNFYIWQLN